MRRSRSSVGPGGGLHCHDGAAGRPGNVRCVLPTCLPNSSLSESCSASTTDLMVYKLWLCANRVCCSARESSKKSRSSSSVVCARARDRYAPCVVTLYTEGLASLHAAAAPGLPRPLVILALVVAPHVFNGVACHADRCCAPHCPGPHTACTGCVAAHAGGRQMPLLPQSLRWRHMYTHSVESLAWI